MRSRNTDPVKIKAAREAAALTQQQLATRLKVHRTAVAKWESATAGKAPSPVHFRKLCRALRCEADTLLAGSDGSQAMADDQAA